MFNDYLISRGEGRTEVQLKAQWMGSDPVIFISNKNAHIGAVSVGEYDPVTERTSTSMITRLGHKDDAVAQGAAYRISKAWKKPVCVIAGIHLEDISSQEIGEILRYAQSLVDEFLQSIPE